MKRVLTCALAVSGALATLGCPPEAGAFALAPQVQYPVGNMPFGLAAGDLDGDGDVDVVAANVLSQTVSVLRNHGDGTFAAATHYPAGGQPRAVSIADLNLDGAPDLFCGLQSGGSTFSVLANDGTGAFSEPQLHGDTAGNVEKIVLGNFDTDSNLDVAVVLGDAGLVLVFRGRSGEDFHRPVSYSIPSTPVSGGIAAGDIDQDGDLDLVASFIYSFGTPAVLVNAGNGSYALAAPFNPDNTNTPAIGVGPLDDQPGDDIVQVSNGSVIVFPNIGGGAFGSPRVFEPGVLTTSVTRLSIADLDADGDRDLIITGSGSSEVGILLNDSAGGYGSASQHATGLFNGDAIAADLNSDGFPDVIASNRDGDSVSILLNQSTTTSVLDPDAGGFELHSVTPNPTRERAFISYRLPRAGRMTLAVHDVAGRLRAVLVNDVVPGGSRSVMWDGRGSDGIVVPAGVYFVRMDAGVFHATRRIVRLR